MLLSINKLQRTAERQVVVADAQGERVLTFILKMLEISENWINFFYDIFHSSLTSSHQFTPH